MSVGRTPASYLRRPQKRIEAHDLFYFIISQSDLLFLYFLQLFSEQYIIISLYRIGIRQGVL